MADHWLDVRPPPHAGPPCSENPPRGRPYFPARDPQQTPRTPVLRPLMIALAIAFPLVAHAAVMSRSGSLTIASLAVLALLVMLPRLVRWTVAAWLSVPVVVGALALLWRVHAAWLPLYATPVLVSFFVAWVFGHTLAPGEVPLIERLARVHARGRHGDCRRSLATRAMSR